MPDLARKNLQLKGAERQKALKDFKKQLKKWGLSMPAVEPQVLDLGTEFSRTGIIEYWVRNEDKQGYCCKFYSFLTARPVPAIFTN